MFFWPKIFGGGRNLRMVLCHSMQVQWWEYHEVWGLSNPTVCKRICLNSLHSKAVEMQKLQVWVLAPSLIITHTLKQWPTWWDFHYLIFLNVKTPACRFWSEKCLQSYNRNWNLKWVFSNIIHVFLWKYYRNHFKQEEPCVPQISVP